MKTVNVCEKANSKFKQNVYNLRRISGKIFWTKPTLIIIFTIIFWTLPWSTIELLELAKVPTKKVFAFKLFQFCNLKNQQRFILEGEVSVSLKKIAAFSDILRQFLKQYDKTVKFPALYTLPRPKQEIGFTLFKNKLFAHFFHDVATDRYVFLFVLSVTRSVVSPSESFKQLMCKTF